MTPAPQPTGTPDPMADLHAAVRKWTEHIPVNLPYIDLMFAFGYATLGDRAKAESLVESSRKVMVVPIPEEWQDNRRFEAVVAAVVSNFLFKAFCYRIEQALAGKPHFGSLSAELLTEFAAITSRAHAGGTNNPYLRAEHVIDSFRVASRILEPHERIDPYRFWTKNHDTLKKRLTELVGTHDPVELTDGVRRLWRDGVSHQPLSEVRIQLLLEVLPVAPRAGEAFVAELVPLVPEVLVDTTGSEPPNAVWRQGRLLEAALFLAGHYGRGDLVEMLTGAFVSLARSMPEDTRYRLINVVATECLRSLKRLGMRDAIDRLLGVFRDEVLAGATIDELRKKCAANPEQWGNVLQTLLGVAGGWLMFRLPEKANPILDAARYELLDPGAARIPPKEYTALAQAYVTALGEGPSEPGFTRLTELFRDMDRRKITNTWTTAQYFSRFHLNLVEDTVRAICPRTPDLPHVVSG